MTNPTCTCGLPAPDATTVHLTGDDAAEFTLCADCLRQMLADYGPDPDRIAEDCEMGEFDGWDEPMESLR